MAKNSQNRPKMAILGHKVFLGLKLKQKNRTFGKTLLNFFWGISMLLWSFGSLSVFRFSLLLNKNNIPSN